MITGTVPGSRKGIDTLPARLPGKVDSGVGNQEALVNIRGAHRGASSMWEIISSAVDDNCRTLRLCVVIFVADIPCMTLAVVLLIIRR
jgi:hypothetical protein